MLIALSSEHKYQHPSWRYKKVYFGSYCIESPEAMQMIYQILLILVFEAYGEDSCGWGKYGDKCDKDCPSNCISHPVRNLRHCHKETGRCSEGCVPGWFEDLCDHACSKNCLRNICNRQNGICTFGCSGNYTGDYCNITPVTAATPPREYRTPWVTDTSSITPSESRPETTPDLTAILVPVFLILIVLAVVVLILILYRRKPKRGGTWLTNAVTAIIPCWRTTTTAKRLYRNRTIGEDEPFVAKQGGARFASILKVKRDDDFSCSLLDNVNLLSETDERKIKDIQSIFVETEAFEEVKERLQMVGHVTISGAPGSGKTSMALMLGAEYRRQGYELVLIEDVDKVQLSDFLDKDRDVCVIFDDMFKTFRSYTDMPRLTHLLYDLLTLLEQCKSRSERSYESLRQESRADQRVMVHLNIFCIFTSETNNLEHTLSMLEDQPISEIILTKTTSLCYTHEESKAIWLNHKRQYKCRADVDMNKIIALMETTVGFPLACKLFSRYTGFQTYRERFFEDPLFYIKHELHTIISLLDDKSAALILLLLCEGQLNISQLEAASDSGLEAHFKAVSSIVKTSARKDVVKAVRGFCGTICTEGNTTAFSHSVIYDVCASVLFSIDQEFTLKHCGITFLFEHVQDQRAKGSPLIEHKLSIPFSGAYSGLIAKRMADAIVSGAFNKYIMHLTLKENKIADSLCEMIKEPAALSDDVKHNILQYACITGNKNVLERLLPYCYIDRHGLCGWTPLMYAVVSGQMGCFDILVNRKADIKLCDSNNYNLLHLACQHGSLLTVKHISMAFKKLRPDLYLNARGRHDWTPLMCAVLSGKKDVLDYLIQTKVDLTLRDSKNDTPLHLACRYGNTSIVESLLPITDVNTRGNNGQTPVMCALLSETKETLDLLVSHNADILLTDDDNNSLNHVACHVDDVSLVVQIVPKFDINIRGKHGWTPVMTAAVNGKADLFRLFLDTLNVDLKLTDDTNNNLLHLACHGGNVSIVMILLPKFDINSRGNNGWTPVMCAAASGVESVFHLLVSHGADVALRDDNNNSAFHLACIGGNISIVKYLLSRTDINCQGNHGRTAVMIAALLAKQTLFKLLLSKKADITLTDDYNDTVLHIACQGGNQCIVKYLMPQFDINAPGRHDRTAVMNAARSGRKDVFFLLVSQKADLTSTDEYKDNVLHMACQGGNTAIVEYLLTIFDVDLRGRNDRTPVMHAARAGQKNVFNLLVSRNADLTPTDEYGNNALHLACQGGNRSIVNDLLPKFVIKVPGKDGWTPLMNAVAYGRRSVFHLLVSKGADVSMKDSHGDSVFHLACQGGISSIVECLPLKNDVSTKYHDIATQRQESLFKKKSFDINIRGRNDQTPLMRAVCGGHIAVFRFLVSRGADQSLVDKDGHTLLHLATQHGQLHMVKYIIDSFDINTKDNAGLTPVMTSVLHGKVATFEYLRGREADLSLVDNAGNNSLDHAHKVGCRQIIELLEKDREVRRLSAAMNPCVSKVSVPDKKAMQPHQCYSEVICERASGQPEKQIQQL
ncbi:serine/threonine-protein phosphatase 6 regulatory ankyrin repeat subunit C-like isoform X2 [Haliotis rufescens]|uniref:serine/threonine-protein phosphatase 6 regulatory ankyrin repeat subunit C-like isoform X2 n=1 Tax=Haliotis rufescens TaxID=6454 RepID=UPI00201E95DA|nr:serine/threonine-protein phosphatase 6 regulatory ankyrin repeat subunit C-like isoform X2 [Haliotis rufescens]